MKMAIISGFVAASILLAGCGKKNDPQSGSTSPAKTSADSASASNPVDAPPTNALAGSSSSLPVTQPILAAWQEGDKAEATSLFLKADWSARPLFATGMALSLSEGQFQALSDDDRQLRSKEMLAQLDLIKQLAAAVAQAGRDDASNGDVAQARKCFTSLKQFGAALDSPDRLRLVQLVGQASKRMADTELARIGK